MGIISKRVGFIDERALESFRRTLYGLQHLGRKGVTQHGSRPLKPGGRGKRLASAYFLFCLLSSWWFCDAGGHGAVV